MNYNFQKTRLIESYFGEWWLDELPEEKITGNFKIFSNGNYQLETNGFFKKYSKPFPLRDTFRIDINGVVRGSNDNYFHLFRLISCFSAGKGLASVSFDFRKTHVSYFLRSRAHKSAEFRVFNKMLLTTLNLDVWLNDQSLEYNACEEGMEIKYKRPLSREIFNSKGYSIKIGNGFHYNMPDHKGFQFKHLPSFEVIFMETTTELETRDVANKLNWFISLSCFSPTYISDYHLYNSISNEDGYATELIYNDKFVDSSYKEIHWHNLLLSMQDFDKHPKLLTDWFQIVDKNPLLVQNLMGVLRNSSEFVENKFLSLINGILTFAEQKLFKKPFKNEKSLHNLFVLYNGCWDSFYFPTRKTTDEMVGRRHILVHNSERVDARFFKEDDFRLNWFSMQLQFVVLAIILRELGFSDNEIDNRLTRLASGRVAFHKDNV